MVLRKTGDSKIWSYLIRRPHTLSTSDAILTIYFFDIVNIEYSDGIHIAEHRDYIVEHESDDSVVFDAVVSGIHANDE
jgi:hypothetical protein